MTKAEARKIGGLQGLKSSAIGLAIAYLIIAMLTSSEGFLKGLCWIVGVKLILNLVVGSLMMLIVGYFFGQLAGKLILIRKWSTFWVGVFCDFFILVATAFLSCWLTFFQEAVFSNKSCVESFFYDFLYPFIVITIVGFIPAALVGIWLGESIRKHKGRTA